MKRLFEPTVERIKQAVRDVIANVLGRFSLGFISSEKEQYRIYAPNTVGDITR